MFYQMPFVFSYLFCKYLYGNTISVFRTVYYELLEHTQYNPIRVWYVSGTTATRCYESGMEKPIRPKIPLELLFALRDYRDYRHRLTGQFRYNSNIRNVHFQFKLNFALGRFKIFLPANFSILEEFLPHLSKEYKRINWVFRYSKDQEIWCKYN